MTNNYEKKYLKYKEKYLELKNQLGSGSPRPEMSENDFKALLHQAYEGETQAVLEAVKQDRRLATRADRLRRTLLHEACIGRGGHVELARGLLARGASVGARDWGGCDAIYHASYRGNVAMVTLLLDRGGDPCTRDINGSTALMMAAWRGHLAVCLLLLSRGADLTVVWEGNTALTMYGENARPSLSPEVLAEGRAALLTAWHAGPHPSQRWARRWPMMSFVTGCRFRPLVGRQGWVPPKGLSLEQIESAQRESARQLAFISFMTGSRFLPFAGKQGWVPPEGLSLEQRERVRRRTLVFSSEVLLRLIVSFL